MRQLIAARLLVSLIIAAGLAAGCASSGGGGGGGGFSPAGLPPPPPPPPPGPPPPPAPGAIPDPSSAEYRNNWGVGHTNAIAAWQRGFTGAGVTVGVIDEGVHPDHPELVGRVDTVNSIDINSSRNQLTSDLSHGSELASLIAGNFNGAQTVGVAYGATILAVRADNGAGTFNESDLAAAVNYAVAHGVDIINFSLGRSDGATNAFRNAIRDATLAGVIIVVSAGNDGAGAPNVNYPGFLASDPSVGNGLIIIAGGLNANGSLNTNSNPPGVVADWYLTAPAWQIIVPDYGPEGPVPNFQQCWPNRNSCTGLVEIQGTSYASPHIAGALALLKEAAPGLTSAQLVDLLLSTALDAGAPGTDSLYGRGILDIARAFQPVGPLMVATAAGSETPIWSPIGTTGAAYGDAFVESQDWTAAAFDNYGRSFEVSLAGGWTPAAPRDIAMEQAPSLWLGADSAGPVVARFAAADPLPPRTLMNRLREAPDAAFQAETVIEGVRFAMAAHAPAYDQSSQPAQADAYLSFAGADLSVALTRGLGDAQISFVSQSSEAALGPAFGESVRVASAVRLEDGVGPVRAALSFGGLRETGAVLGATWTPPWGEKPDGATTFAGLSVSWSPAKTVQAALGAEFGRTRIIGGDWLQLEAPLITSAFSAAVRVTATPAPLAAGATGAFTLSVSQPLRVEEGAFSALLPQSDAWGRAHLSFAPRTISARPSGREIETRLSYWLWGGDAFIARAELAYRAEPGHRVDADDAVELLVGLRLRN